MNAYLVDRHSYNFDNRVNGGESLLFTTEIFANGDIGGIFLNQKLTLCSYGNSANIQLSNINITPETLRNLANELDIVINRAKNKIGGASHNG